MTETSKMTGAIVRNTLALAARKRAKGEHALADALEASARSFPEKVAALDEPRHTRSETDRPLSGWCSVCGEYLSRSSASLPILNPDGSRHSHTDPWDLGEQEGGK